VLALIFGHALWVRIVASRQASRLSEVIGLYAQNAVIEGALCATGPPGAVLFRGSSSTLQPVVAALGALLEMVLIVTQWKSKPSEHELAQAGD